MKMRLIAALGVAGSLLYGQTGSVAGPSSGYVFDPSVRALRQIRGIPGAATMGDPLDLGIAAGAAAVSPRGDFAVATAEDGSAHLFRLNDGAAAGRAVSGLLTAAESVVFSPSGTAAALYRPGSIQVLKGLPDSPEVAITLAMPSLGSGAAEAAAYGKIRQTPRESIAISDDAAYVLYARASEVDLVSVAGGMRKLLDSHAGALVAFAAGGHDAAIAAGGVVTVFQDVAGASARRDFPGGGLPAGLAFSSDGSRVLLAGTRGVSVVDRAAGTRAQVECDCKPTGMAPMGSLFRLNDPGAGPLWLLDISAEPKVWFVPARAGA